MILNFPQEWYYLKNKVGVVDSTKARGLLKFEITWFDLTIFLSFLCKFAVLVRYSIFQFWKLHISKSKTCFENLMKNLSDDTLKLIKFKLEVFLNWISRIFLKLQKIFCTMPWIHTIPENAFSTPTPWQYQLHFDNYLGFQPKTTPA